MKGEIMKRMIVHCGPGSTEIALLENGKLVEYAAERSQHRGLVGSFIKGKVVNVIPGMQAAFVDIGQKRMRFSISTTCCTLIWKSNRSRSRRSPSF
ncbi:hypothetical protein HMSSN139_17770 [Paenibacillus sp. HMSSN-139]|nr:hypothetical protein HMSSN139_17770 [Paenibacillus sp. HMSSN-139]